MSTNQKILYVSKPDVGGILPNYLTALEVNKVRTFHQSMKEYEVTPLVALDNLAKELGVKKIYVKDESYRFNLNAFKALGGTFSLAKLLCKRLDIDIEEITFEYFNQPEIKEKIANLIFVTATDGNHGRGIAWAASKLGCKSVVYMPKGSSERRLQAIKDAGAEAFITEMNYDDAVRFASEKATKEGWILVQDTAWEGYEEIPTWVTQGYTTMAAEAIDQMMDDGFKSPTHVFLQAGVGSLAGGVLGYFANLFEENCPITTIVEAEAANCIYQSALINDGNPHIVSGDLETIMAGLACGEPNPITWKILRDFASCYVSCPDYVSAHGMRVLANPVGNDKKVISGESGSVGVGLFEMIMSRDALEHLRNELKLTADSIVLFFNTEGDTDKEHYRKIVIEGKNPSGE